LLQTHQKDSIFCSHYSNNSYINIVPDVFIGRQAIQQHKSLLNSLRATLQLHQQQQSTATTNIKSANISNNFNDINTGYDFPILKELQQVIPPKHQQTSSTKRRR
jgi:stress-induced morphogen